IAVDLHYIGIARERPEAGAAERLFDPHHRRFLAEFTIEGEGLAFGEDVQVGEAGRVDLWFRRRECRAGTAFDGGLTDELHGGLRDWSDYAGETALQERDVA